jgi:hypothetical protein
MTLLIEQNQEAIFDLCRKYGVVRGTAVGLMTAFGWQHPRMHPGSGKNGPQPWLQG